MLRKLVLIVAAGFVAAVTTGTTGAGATGRGIAVASMPAYIGPSERSGTSC